MKEQNPVSRRTFIQRLTVFGAAGTAAGSILVGCGGGGEEAAEVAEVCYDPATAPPEQQRLYQSLQYVEQSEVEGRYCNNCIQWQPAEGGAYCGGCQVLAGGLVNPQGWCNVWAPMPGVDA